MALESKIGGASTSAWGSSALLDEQKSARCLVRFLLWAQDEAREGLNDNVAAGHIEMALASLCQRYKIDPQGPL